MISKVNLRCPQRGFLKFREEWYTSYRIIAVLTLLGFDAICMLAATPKAGLTWQVRFLPSGQGTRQSHIVNFVFPVSLYYNRKAL